MPDTDTTTEISQEAAHAMLAALKALTTAIGAWRAADDLTMAGDEIVTAWSAARAAIAQAEGRAP